MYMFFNDHITIFASDTIWCQFLCTVHEVSEWMISVSYSLCFPNSAGILPDVSYYIHTYICKYLGLQGPHPFHQALRELFQVLFFQVFPFVSENISSLTLSWSSPEQFWNQDSSKSTCESSCPSQDDNQIWGHPSDSINSRIILSLLLGPSKAHLEILQWRYARYILHMYIYVGNALFITHRGRVAYRLHQAKRKKSQQGFVEGAKIHISDFQQDMSFRHPYICRARAVKDQKLKLNTYVLYVRIVSVSDVCRVDRIYVHTYVLSMYVPCSKTIQIICI